MMNASLTRHRNGTILTPIAKGLTRKPRLSREHGSGTPFNSPTAQLAPERVRVKSHCMGTPRGHASFGHASFGHASFGHASFLKFMG